MAFLKYFPVCHGSARLFKGLTPLLYMPLYMWFLVKRRPTLYYMYNGDVIHEIDLVWEI